MDMDLVNLSLTQIVFITLSYSFIQDKTMLLYVLQNLINHKISIFTLNTC